MPRSLLLIYKIGPAVRLLEDEAHQIEQKHTGGCCAGTVPMLQTISDGCITFLRGLKQRETQEDAGCLAVSVLEEEKLPSNVSLERNRSKDV